MTTTLEDLMNFMKSDKEERVRERQSDKEELKQLINGVKAEVEAVIVPIKKKQEELEIVQADMQKSFSDLVADVKDMKKQLASQAHSQASQQSQSRSAPLSYAQAAVVGLAHDHVSGQVGEVQEVRNNMEEKLGDIVSLGRRTVGLSRINKADLIRMRQEQYGGAKSEEEEKMLAVKEFMKCEMKFDDEALGEMEIERIFFPAKKKDPEYLYVTFRYERSVSRIFQRTRCMRKESRILIYIPKEFHDRYDDLAGFEYKLRKLENFQTRIKWGFEDLELHKKVRGSERWEKVALPKELPKVNMNPRRSLSLSPAPGRPHQSQTQNLARGEKRDRGSPGLTPDQAKQKSLRQDGEVDKTENIRSKRSDIWKEIIEKADLVGEATISPTKENQGLKSQLDTGLITSITGTPAKAASSELQVFSPIFSKTSKNTN